MPATFSAEIRLLPTAEGGRETPMRSGYRSLVRLGAADREPAWGVQIDFDSSSLAPATAGEVRVRVWAWDDADPAHGTPLFLYEGNRLVGTGTVI